MTENNPTTRGARPGRGAAMAEQRRQAARRRDARRRTIGVIVAALAVVVIAVVALAGSSDDGSEEEAAPPPGTRTFDDLSREHVPGNVSYPQTPPVGGDHNGIWQDCGYYQESIMPEKGVHSMEHGAVWVTYRRDLPAEQVAALRRLAEDQTYILASPWPDGLPAPVVASAWGRQLTLASATAPELDDFVRAFRQGPQTPEPGAVCTGGESGMG